MQNSAHQTHYEMISLLLCTLRRRTYWYAYIVLIVCSKDKAMLMFVRNKPTNFLKNGDFKYSLGPLARNINRDSAVAAAMQKKITMHSLDVRVPQSLVTSKVFFQVSPEHLAKPRAGLHRLRYAWPRCHQHLSCLIFRHRTHKVYGSGEAYKLTFRGTSCKRSCFRTEILIFDA